MIDLEIREAHIKEETIESVMKCYDKPAVFQTELKELLDNYLKAWDSIIEIGCELAATTFLLRDDVEKYLLDYNENAIQLSSQAFKLKGKKIAETYVMDMFNMDMDGKLFDIVFNAWVLEHYDLKTRTKAIASYEKILQPGGKMILAIPNHYSWPYKFAYTTLRLFRVRRFPSEEKIYDFSKEIANISSLSMRERKILSKWSVLSRLNFFKPIKWLFTVLSHIFPYEGYLTVIVLEKKDIVHE